MTPYTYPFIMMNHHAIMLIMLRNNLKFVKQVSEAMGMPVRPFPVMKDPDPTKPVAWLYKSASEIRPVDLEKALAV